MIRTSIILSPRHEASDRLFFHANGLQIDVATASQLIVRTSHRPVQIYSANRSGIRHQAQNLTSQTGTHGLRWQRLMDILDRQGSDALKMLYQEGDITGEWIVALDEDRLNALLSDRFSFFLFRDGQLRELPPVGQTQQTGPDTLAHHQGLLNHFRISVSQDDQILIMPAGMIPPGNLQESELILSGMQQLPVRLSELGARLRERGVTASFNGWIALQILRADPEYKVPERGFRSWLASHRKSEIDPNDPGFSDRPQEIAENPRGDSQVTEEESGNPTAALNPRLSRKAWIALLVVIAVAVLLFVFKDALGGPTETTRTTSPSVAATTTTARPTPIPTVAAKPTTTATTTAAPVEMFVLARKLNLREEPNISSKLIRTLTTGESVFLLEKTNEEWSMVRTADGVTGYVYSSYISDAKPAG